LSVEDKQTLRQAQKECANLDKAFYLYMVLDCFWTLRSHHKHYGHNSHTFTKQIQKGIALLTLRVSAISEGTKYLS